MSHIVSATVASANSRACAGLKSQTFVQHFGGVDLLVGENGAGKTTHGPLAITAGIEGLAERPTDPRRPYVGQPPANTAICLTLDNGATLVRDLSMTRGKSVDEANATARKLIGIPPTAWDLRDFATGTDGDRGAILDAAARAGGAIQAWDMATAIGRVRELHADLMDEKNDPSAWQVPVDQCTRALTAAADGADWLKAAEKWAEAEQVKANAAQKSARAHAEQVAAQAPEKPGHDAAADKARASALHRERAALESSAQDRARALAAMTRHGQEGERLRAALEATKDEGQRLAVVTPAPDATVPADVAQRLAEAQAAMDAPVPPADGSRIPALEKALADAEADLEKAYAEADEAGGKIVPLEDAARVTMNAMDGAQQAVDRAGEAIIAADARVKTLESLSTDGPCANCGDPDPHRHGSALDTARLALEAAKAEAAPLVEALDIARSAHATASQALAEGRAAARLAAVAYAAPNDARNAARANLAAARDALAGHEATVKTARQRDLDAARQAVAREEARIAREVAAHAAAEAARTEALQAARARYKATAAALAEWTASEAPTVPPEPDAGVLEGIAQELAEIERRTRAMLSWEQAVTAARTAMETADSARLTWESIKALVSACRKARDELASVAYRPTEAAAQGLLRDADGLPMPYFAGPGDYGAIVPGRGRVPFHGLSESEQRITAAALVFALATVAKNPVRVVLLDGIEVVQADHRVPLIRALVRARAEGLVDNVIMTMATAPGEDLAAYRIDGLTIHEIARDAVQVVELPVQRAAPVTSGSLALAEPVLDDEVPF